ncbi:uncharacterized protein C4orf54 homolog [Scyliorhinus canicula]|uniref:uncharacterized protein C4orf54 homolog n=1 Tax=Scyliorhinus canicula TaxID=7830 RepID=UPI0018F5B8E6|nr:uncharacterized protein C4orf54 homolog [Scyliorhinus canicula]
MRREESGGDSRRRSASGEETRAAERGSLRLGWPGEPPAQFSGCEMAAGSEICRRKEGGTGNTEDRQWDVSWDHSQSAGKDEVQFISTHEIQLYELDHDGECEVILGSCCALEEGSATCTFLDSSSGQSDASEEGSQTPRAASCAGDAPPPAEEADGQRNGEWAADGGHPGSANCAGRIHLSIRASSRALEMGTCADSQKERNWRGIWEDSPAEVRADGGRSAALESFSGSSGGPSELDDADKEVGSLTSRTFRSLARPADEYFDTFCAGHRSASLSSPPGDSARCSEIPDLPGGKAAANRNGSQFAGGNPASSAGPGSQSHGAARKHSPAEGVANAVPNRQENGAGGVSGGQREGFGSRVTPPSGIPSWDGKERLPARRRVRNAAERREAAQRESSGERGRAAADMEQAPRRSVLACSLLQNVIGKKMQLEQELRMERGEICPPSPPGPAELTGSPDLPEPPAEQRAGGFGSERSAFRLWADRRDRERLLSGGSGTGAREAARRVRAHIGRQSLCQDRKMSHLFVPGIQRAAGGQGAKRPSHLAQRGATSGQGSGEGESGEGVGRQGGAFSSANLPPPDIGESAAGRVEQSRFQALCMSLAEEDPRSKAPHFTVRDIREDLHKLQTPLHQVRDVRKLVKTSYQLLKLQNRDPLPSGAVSSLLPIVLQAVSRRDSAGRRVPGESSGGSSPDTSMKISRAPLSEAAAGSSPGVAAASKQLALEKLTAAVRTMEELYVFDKNEWKRKSESGAGSLAGSHVLSLIASEERAAFPPVPRVQAAAAGKPPGPPTGTQGTGPHLFTVAPVPQQVKPARARSPPPPESRSLRAPHRQDLEEPSRAAQTPVERQSGSQNPQQALPSEYGNYLTIPIKAPPPTAAYSLPPGRQHSPSPKQQREPSPATIYHQPPPRCITFTPPGMQPPELISPVKVQPPVLMDSPPVPCYPAPHTQRKMLLDPSTGQYYLVDTPIQPACKRLYDPETRQYVDVPMPQQPMAPMPVPMSPIAINPGTYGTTYMIYPGFLPSPAMLPNLPTPLSRPENECNETGKPYSTVCQPSDVHYMESPYYSPTGKTLNPMHTLTSQPITRASKAFSEGKPVISFTSQPGPRIIAPPSFDGTTMSFVVEHR